MKTKRIAWLVGVLVLLPSAIGQQRFGRVYKLGVDRSERTEAVIMAVKTTRFLGTVDTNWETAGNWSNGQPSTTGDKDSVFIAREAIRDLLVNVDRTGDNFVSGTPDETFGLDLAIFEIEEGCRINVGTAANPLKLTADKVILHGGNNVHLVTQTGADGTTKVDKLIVDTPATAVFLDFIDGPPISEFLSGTSVLQSVADDSHEIRMSQSVLFSFAVPELTMKIGQKPAVTPTLINMGRLVLDGTAINGTTNNNGATVELKNNSFIGTYTQGAGSAAMSDAQQARGFATAIIMGGTLDTRTQQTSHDVVASTKLVLFPGATWLGTARQEAATVVERIGE